MLQEQLDGVTFVDGTQTPFPEHHRRIIPYEHAGFAFKAFALYSTSFQQVNLRSYSDRYILDHVHDLACCMNARWVHIRACSCSRVSI